MGFGDDLFDPDAAPKRDAPKLKRKICKVIVLGTANVGKTSLMKRYVANSFTPVRKATMGADFMSKSLTLNDQPVLLQIWDTAGQERFNKMHPAYYHRAHVCILVFDVTRKNTYQHLSSWYAELRDSCENIPCILVANKIDVDYKVTRKNFKFASEHNLPFYFVSAADGTNIVKVFEAAVAAGIHYKENGGDFFAEVQSVMDSLGDAKVSD